VCGDGSEAYIRYGCAGQTAGRIRVAHNIIIGIVVRRIRHFRSRMLAEKRRPRFVTSRLGLKSYIITRPKCVFRIYLKLARPRPILYYYLLPRVFRPLRRRRRL